MGLYDRAYATEDQVYRDRPQLSMIVKIVIVTGIVFLVDSLSVGENGEHPIGNWLALNANWFLRPWDAYRLLTYGFVHADLWHILFNMFGLWMIGRLLEQTIGGREFLAFYLVSIVASGAIWSVIAFFGHVAGQPFPFVIGASGAVASVIIATVLRYPKETVYLYGIIAMPFWVFGVMFVGFDLVQAFFNKESNVAFTAHLGGAGFGFLYHYSGIRLESLVKPEQWSNLFKRKPRLKVVRQPEADKLDDEADRILQKIHEQGQDSLTAREQKVLEKYSRRVNQRRQKDPWD
jgi:membrane associated rhomboid family serine protease